MTLSFKPPGDAEQSRQLYATASILLKPTTKDEPDVWAWNNRVYAPTTGVPGRRDVGLTPYMIPFIRALHNGTSKLAVMVCGAQMGKTEATLDLLGARLDQRPAPVVYVGPSKQFLEEQFEPRFAAMLDEVPGLRQKRSINKRERKTLKWVAGVKARLAHAGSSGALKSDPFVLAVMDEYDEMLSNIRGQGDPLGLVEARGYTYADAVVAVTSTPSQGAVEVEIDPESGLEFWKVGEPEEIESPIWRMFQGGTRYHWSWPCPECEEYFVPRFKHLQWRDGASPAEALRTAHLVCPCNGCVIEDDIEGATRRWMNERGLYVAPGQRIVDGEVIGDPPESTVVSFWVSGLCSPFVTWGSRAEQYLRALGTGEKDKVQTAINAGFGEVYSFGAGEAPSVSELQKLRSPDYVLGEVPEGVARLTMGVDVHKTRINWVVRGWGANQASWLVDRGEIWGRTGVEDQEVWHKLEEVLGRQYDGLPIRLAFVDSGFKPNASNSPSEHRVYQFCRKNSRNTFAVKGFDQRPVPIEKTTVDVTMTGSKAKFGLDVLLVDSDHHKSWVYDRIKRDPTEPGAWMLPADIDDDYCRQVVSEVRTLKDNGRPKWIPIVRANHFLDCEALAFAAAKMLGVEKVVGRVSRPKPKEPEEADERPAIKKAAGMAAFGRLNRG